MTSQADEVPPDRNSDEPETAPSLATRSGYVTLVGRPNAGKSTLLNAFLDTHLSIVTPKAQTTWQRVTGILTEGSTQIVFLDTPGVLDARSIFQRSMLEAAHEATSEADVVLAVLDGKLDDPNGLDEVIGPVLDLSRAPLIAAVNKVDVAPPERIEALVRWVSERGGTAFGVSALRGTGVEDLRAAIEKKLPSGPFLFPEDEIATQPVRFFVAELVREVVFEQYSDEIPYATISQVEEFREGEDPVYIGVTLFVERESQKGILVGKGGRAIRALGTEARQRIEHFLGRRVYLDLWVKKLPNWRRRRGHLTRLGFRVAEENHASDA